jgi:3-carboxy-cis,cis-muconate cycloisomerase
MARNLASTGGLIAAEQVMMGLAPVLGRGEAHHIVNHACDVALAQGIPLAEALLADPQISARMPPGEVHALCAPENYLGQAMVFVDQVLARLG